MRVQVVGAGAVGLLMASFYAEMGCEVTLVCRRFEQILALRKGLSRTNLDSSIVTVPVQVSQTITSDVDLIIIAVKSGQLEDVMKQLPSNVPLLFVQNGLLQVNLVKKYNFQQVLFGSAQFGATKKDEAHVLHKGIGILKVAAYQRDLPIMKQLLSMQSQKFPVELHTNAHEMLFEKALLNCYINPLTALLEIKNGQLLTNNKANLIMRQLHAELSLAFPTTNVSYEAVENLCKITAGNTSSMLADHLAKRCSEAPAIVGAIINKALSNGQQLPTLTTLYHLILGKEQQGGYR